MKPQHKQSLPRLVRGITTWGIVWGNLGMMYRWNMPVSEYWMHHRIHRGKSSCVEVGPLLIQF